jgi:hypothetical protein
MISYVLAFGILFVGSAVALLLNYRVPLRRLRTVRRFRKDLARLELVTVFWRESQPDDSPRDEQVAPQWDRSDPHDEGGTLV